MDQLDLREFETLLKAALSLDLAYPDRAHRELSESGLAEAKPAAVLVLLAPENTQVSIGFSVLLTLRTEWVETHKGQISFPGGHCEPEDRGEAVSTALREAEEEVGISPEDVEVLGSLPLLATVSGFMIHPIVGISKKSLPNLALKLNPDEIAEAIWVPMEVLENPSTYKKELLEVKGVHYPIHVYQVGEHRIWGATGSILKNLLDRLRIRPLTVRGDEGGMEGT